VLFADLALGLAGEEIGAGTASIASAQTGVLVAAPQLDYVKAQSTCVLAGTATASIEA
jgi:hypothetical protein